MSAPAAEPTVAGFRRNTLITVAVVAALVWAGAIYAGSLVLYCIVGGLTAAIVGLFVWAHVVMKRQRRLQSLLEGAVQSPEARKAALAELDASKDAKDIPMIFARAQLVAADDPARALEMLEAVELKKVPPQMQDDFAYLRAYLCLSFGRTQDARPLVDTINVDSPVRKDSRAMIVGVVAETWARTGKAKEALELLGSVDTDAEKEEIAQQLQAARVFATFALGRTRDARKELESFGRPDVNRLGRFLAPRFRVNPELQRLAREVAQRQAQRSAPRPRRGPPR